MPAGRVPGIIICPRVLPAPVAITGGLSLTIRLADVCKPCPH